MSTKTMHNHFPYKLVKNVWWECVDLIHTSDQHSHGFLEQPEGDVIWCRWENRDRFFCDWRNSGTVWPGSPNAKKNKDCSPIHSNAQVLRDVLWSEAGSSRKATRRKERSVCGNRNLSKPWELPVKSKPREEEREEGGQRGGGVCSVS